MAHPVISLDEEDQEFRRERRLSALATLDLEEEDELPSSNFREPWKSDPNTCLRDIPEMNEMTTKGTSWSPLHSGMRPRVAFPSGSTYLGEWLGFKRHGFGIMTWPDGSIFKGQFQYNAAEGLGFLIHTNGDTYVGEWRANVPHGKGVYKFMNGTRYEGFFENVQDGSGVETLLDGSCYQGEFKSGMKHGAGKYQWNSKQATLYGQWTFGQVNGLGLYESKESGRFQGEWMNALMHGRGRYTWADGRIYSGDYAHDQKQGFGCFVWPDGRRYEGHWRGGKQHGVGKCTTTARGAPETTIFAFFDDGQFKVSSCV